MTEPTTPKEPQIHRALAGIAVTKLSADVLQELMRKAEGSTPVRIIAGVVARAMRTTSSIQLLCANRDIQSAWVLHRTLVERLFHLAHLAKSSSYDAFEQWSFFEQAKAQQRARSDPMFKAKTAGEAFSLTDDQARRFSSMLKEPPVWRRPKAKDVAKGMGVEFIYHYAYDFASTMIHPMANDGEMDLAPAQTSDWASQMETIVVENSLIVMTLILQEAMNSPPLNWCGAAYQAVEATRRFIHDPTVDCHRPLQGLRELAKAGVATGFPK